MLIHILNTKDKKRKNSIQIYDTNKLVCCYWWTSSGKTKVIEHLAFLGFPVIPEAARVLIDVEKSKGKSIKEIRSNETEFQKKVLEMKIEIENRVPSDQITFFDRGMPDTIAYDKIYGLNESRAMSAFQKRKYKGIFLLEQVPFENDYGRTEDEKFANNLNGLLYKSYSDLGYNIAKIPVMPIDERVKLILRGI